MELIVTVPESATVAAADVAAGAALRLGWTAEHQTTAAEYLAEWLAEQVWTHYRSYRHDLVDAEVRTDLPRPARRRPVESESIVEPGGGARP